MYLFPFTFQLIHIFEVASVKIYACVEINAFPIKLFCEGWSKSSTNGRSKGEGKRGHVSGSLSPHASPFIPLLLSSQLSRRTRAETLATHVTKILTLLAIALN